MYLNRKHVKIDTVITWTIFYQLAFEPIMELDVRRERILKISVSNKSVNINELLTHS